MATYKFKALDADGKHTEGVLEAASSQEARRMVKEQGLLPVAMELTAGGDVLPATPPGPKTKTAHEVAKDHAFGWRIRIRKLLVFQLPLFLLAGVEFYLFVQGKPTWLLGLLAFGGLIGFGIAGMVVELKLLDTFVCPRCRKKLANWDRDEKYHVFYDCHRCEVRWDIGYKMRPGRRKHG
ncbi:MAG: hypothetical protein P4N60_24795 [Verrucomicrobiae bacterium]|nr:hypothetical protein [Verrucomicrobiae bacterium]